MTKQFAVIGNPIEQSRSPELHHAFAAKTGVDLNYKKFLLHTRWFRVPKAFFDQNGVGMNVTVPKEQAFALCDQLTERAKIAKAVNTLWIQDGQLYGDNTDGQGLVAAIQALNWNLANSHILILGAEWRNTRCDLSSGSSWCKTNRDCQPYISPCRTIG